MLDNEMADVTERKFPWHMRLCIQAVLLTGAVFFLLPLCWMIATSLKPLGETLKTPEKVSDIFVGKGHQCEIDGTRYNVELERPIKPKPENPIYIVRPKETFAAGELSLPFGAKTWRKYPVFNEDELARMNTPVTARMKVLADDKNRFDPATGVLTLYSGRKVPAELLRQIKPDPNGEKLWLVRQWLPEDTDAKEVGSGAGDLTRPWDVVRASRIRESFRVVPHNYPVALRRVHFLRSLRNTLYLCLMRVGGTVISAVIVAYGFAFIDFKGKKFLFGLTLATMMIPFVVVMVPVYLLYRYLGWVGTFKPLWVTAWFGSAFSIFLLRQFFLGLPKDLLDAARIDGCSELEILWHVVVPLSRPAITMVALFAFLTTWKDFLGPLIYLNHESQFTLSLSLQAFASEHGGTPWHLLMAASTVFSLPLIILFFAAMKTFIRGIAMTGIKG